MSRASRRWRGDRSRDRAERLSCLSRYTKALDQIKSLRKDQGIEIKVDKAKLDALKQDRDRATKVGFPALTLGPPTDSLSMVPQLRKYVQDLEAEIEAKQADHTALEEEVAQLVGTNTTFFNQASKYQDIIGKAETLMERRNLVENNLSQLRASLTELSGKFRLLVAPGFSLADATHFHPDSDAELNKKIANHEDSLQQLKTEREGLKQKMGDESDSLAAYERKRSQAQTKHGSLLAQKEVRS